MQVLQNLQQAGGITASFTSYKSSWPRVFFIKVRKTTTFNGIVQSLQKLIRFGHRWQHFVSVRFCDETDLFRLPRYHSISRNNYGAPYPVSRTWRSEKMPSWYWRCTGGWWHWCWRSFSRWEFVQYLITTPPSSYDEHWIPVGSSWFAHLYLFSFNQSSCCWQKISQGVNLLFPMFSSLHTNITFWDNSGATSSSSSPYWSPSLGGGARACGWDWGSWRDQTSTRER